MEEERLYDVYALDEDIEIVENFIKHYKEKSKEYKDNLILKDIVNHCFYGDVPAQAIEHLIEAYRKVKDSCIELATTVECLHTDLKEKEEDYTSVYLKGVYDEKGKWKSKVKEKIEELEKELEEINEKYSLQNFPKHMKREEEEQDKLYWELTDNIRLKIKVLQELLEEEK